jgi:hypothetical protein
VSTSSAAKRALVASGRGFAAAAYDIIVRVLRDGPRTLLVHGQAAE